MAVATEVEKRMSNSSKKMKQAKEADSKPLRTSEAPATKTKIVRAQKRNNKTGKSKRAQLIELLGYKSGATIDVIAKTLKWKPHSGRAAISNLRKAVTAPH